MCISDYYYYYNNVYQPTLVRNMALVTKVAAGNGHVLFLAPNNTVYVCGQGGYGQLGLGYDYSSAIYAVRQITQITDAIDIGVGAFHSFYISRSNQVFAFGSDSVRICK